MSKSKKAPSKTDVAPPWPTFERVPDPSDVDPGEARVSGVLLNVVGQGWALFPNPGTTRQEAEELLELIRPPQPGPIPVGGPYRLEEAARAITAQAGGNPMEWAHDLAQTMRNSALAGDLRLRHPKTLFPADPEAVLNDDWGYLVCTRDDLNAWLEAAGYPVRVPSAGAQQEAPRESVALVSPRSLGEKWTHEHRAELMRQHKALSDRGHKFAQADEMIAEAWNTSPSSIKQQRLASKKGV